MVRIDAHRIYVQQARIAAVVRNDDAGCGSAFFKEDLVANAAGPIPIPDVEITQIGIVFYEVEGRGRRLGNQAQLVEQRRV
jgi:hypothetical protein